MYLCCVENSLKSKCVIALNAAWAAQTASTRFCVLFHTCNYKQRSCRDFPTIHLMRPGTNLRRLGRRFQTEGCITLSAFLSTKTHYTSNSRLFTIRLNCCLLDLPDDLGIAELGIFVYYVK